QSAAFADPDCAGGARHGDRTILLERDDERPYRGGGGQGATQAHRIIHQCVARVLAHIAGPAGQPSAGARSTLHGSRTQRRAANRYPSGYRGDSPAGHADPRPQRRYRAVGTCAERAVTHSSSFNTWGGAYAAVGGTRSDCGNHPVNPQTPLASNVLIGGLKMRRARAPGSLTG